MKVRNSLRSLKNRHRDCRVVRRKGRVYVINKTQRRFKARQGYADTRISVSIEKAAFAGSLFLWSMLYSLDFSSRLGRSCASRGTAGGRQRSW